jgi:hypothetical protein
MTPEQTLPSLKDALLHVIEHLNIDTYDQQRIARLLFPIPSPQIRQIRHPSYSRLSHLIQLNRDLAISIVRGNPKRRAMSPITEQAIDVARSRFLEATQTNTPFAKMVTERLATMTEDGSLQRFSIHIEQHGPLEVVVHGRGCTSPSERGSLGGALTEGTALYHGTSVYSASSIVTDGIDWRMLGHPTDFGLAFYTTPDWKVAYRCALINELPFQVVAILEFDADVLRIRSNDILSIDGHLWDATVRAYAGKSTGFVKDHVHHALIVTGSVANVEDEGEPIATGDVQFAFRPGDDNLKTLRSHLLRVHILPAQYSDVEKPSVDRPCSSWLSTECPECER